MKANQAYGAGIEDEGLLDISFDNWFNDVDPMDVLAENQAALFSDRETELRDERKQNNGGKLCITNIDVAGAGELYVRLKHPDGAKSFFITKASGHIVKKNDNSYTMLTCQHLFHRNGENNSALEVDSGFFFL